MCARWREPYASMVERAICFDSRLPEREERERREREREVCGYQHSLRASPYGGQLDDHSGVGVRGLGFRVVLLRGSGLCCPCRTLDALQRVVTRISHRNRFQ